jgi:tight adherence protein B
MNDEMMAVFIVLVFATVFLLMAGLTMPVFGENAKHRRRLKARATQLGNDKPTTAAIELRKDALKDLSSLALQLESLDALSKLRQLIAQSGNDIAARHLLLLSLMLACAGSMIALMLTHKPVFALLVGVVVAPLPVVKILLDRNKRLARLEEQLPDAIDVMKRALQAGHPFNESLNLVAMELDDPIATEFGETFADLNYGNDAKYALLGLLRRVPSVNVMAMVTSVLVQRETGGNLAEVLDNLSRVIRARFKFHRKVRTMSAEGRLSAWVLCMVPFALIALLMVTTPDYLPVLLEHPVGHKLIVGSLAGMVVGIFWINRIIRIEA